MEHWRRATDNLPVPPVPPAPPHEGPGIDPVTREWRQWVEGAMEGVAGRLVEMERRATETAIVQASTGEMVKRLAADVGAALTIHASNAESISSNTRITLDMKERFEAFTVRAMPAVEVTEAMQKGAIAIGKTVDFLHRNGVRVVKFGAIVLGVWVALKVLTATGSWGDAVKAFLAIQIR